MIAAVTMAAPASADSAAAHTTLAGSQPDWASSAAKVGAVPASKTITTRVYLAGQDPDGLAAEARAVADPNSPSYGHYLTPAQIQAQYGATADQVAKVTAWLAGSGLTVKHTSPDWLDVNGSAADVQKAFSTQLDNYKLADGSVQFAPASAAQLPASVAGIVAGVSGLSSTPKTNDVHSVKVSNAKGINNSSTPSCSTTWGQQSTTQFPAAPSGSTIPIDVCPYDPKQLRDAYGITASHLTGKGATIAVIDWYASPTMLADANQYSVNHGDKPFAPGQYSEVVTPGQWANQDLCGSAAGEEALDIDMAHGLAPDAKVVYIGANSCFDADLQAAEAYVVDNHAADVVSNSWGGIMHTTDQGDEDPAVMAGYDRIFEKGALEGIGFDFSSGDCGDNSPLAAQTGANCAPDSSEAQVQWPASSSWVTAVGGTTLATNKNGSYKFETSMGDNVTFALPGDKAWNPSPAPFYFGGGGGTSYDTAQPWYQAWTVPTSQSKTLMNGTKSATPMRTIPDVSLNGSLATSVLVGQTDPASGVYSEGGYGGTSVAAPEFSAMQADAKQASHGRPVGFANPEIYLRNAFGLFNDVTAHVPGQPKTIDTVYEYLHTNPDGSKVLKGALYVVGQDTSLQAKNGYDEATGVGSPNVDYLDSFKWGLF